MPVEVRRLAIVQVAKPPLQMDQRTIKRVFELGKVHTFDEQAAKLRREIAARPRDFEPYQRVRADPAHNELIVGRMRVKPGELREALRALGFQLVRVKSEQDAA